MTKAYIIADVMVTNPEQMLQYREWSTKAMQEFNATVLVRGGAITVFEGDWQPSRLVVLSFESAAQAQTFYNSQTYQHAKKLRENAGVMRMVMVEGV